MELVIHTKTRPKGQVMVEVELPDKADFGDVMCACEYLMCVVAAKSHAGFERALELLCQGAMTYRRAPQETEDR